MTNIGIFHTLIHKKRHKWSLFYYLKVYNDCSFSFNSKMTFSVSQLDVVEMKNWEHVLNAHEKVVTEMPSDVLEHFFSGLFLWKFDVLHSKFTLKVTFLSRMSFVFSDISYLCWKFRPSFVGPFETSGALILGLTRFWSTVLVVLELQGFEVESTKKVSFSKEKLKLKIWLIESHGHLKFWIHICVELNSFCDS